MSQNRLHSAASGIKHTGAPKVSGNGTIRIFGTTKMADLRAKAGGDSCIEAGENLADDCVLIVGGGPVGLLTAVALAFYGVPSVILERNSETTR